MKTGDTVYPKTLSGLKLSDVPCNGEWNQSKNVTCIFRGRGKVLDKHQTFIDYDEWDRQENREVQNLGTLSYISYLIECDAGIGWAGEGAILKANT